MNTKQIVFPECAQPSYNDTPEYYSTAPHHSNGSPVEQWLCINCLNKWCLYCWRFNLMQSYFHFLVENKSFLFFFLLFAFCKDLVKNGFHFVLLRLLLLLPFIILFSLNLGERTVIRQISIFSFWPKIFFFEFRWLRKSGLH